jgi:predicted MFS family arabinose efflux permease
VTTLAPEPVRSEALGAYTALGSLGGGVGSAVGGVVAGSVGYVAAFGLAAGCVLVALVLVLRGARAGERTVLGVRSQ